MIFFSDWTSLDPAIVSYRQFSQFNPQAPPQPPPQQAQQNQNDMYMSQMTQQGELNHFHLHNNENRI